MKSIMQNPFAIPSAAALRRRVSEKSVRSCCSGIRGHRRYPVVSPKGPPGSATFRVSRRRRTSSPETVKSQLYSVPRIRSSATAPPSAGRSRTPSRTVVAARRHSSSESQRKTSSLPVPRSGLRTTASPRSFRNATRSSAPRIGRASGQERPCSFQSRFDRRLSLLRATAPRDAKGSPSRSARSAARSSDSQS